jgi:DNA-binding transcriptional MerR regulator
VTRYSRQHVLRMLHLRERQLAAWEQAGLIPVNTEYSFEDLSQLKALQGLRAMRITPRGIRDSLRCARLWVWRTR